MPEITSAVLQALLRKVEGPSTGTRYLAVQDLPEGLGSPQAISRERFKQNAHRGPVCMVSWSGLYTKTQGRQLDIGVKGQLIEACAVGAYYFVRVPPAQHVYHDTFVKKLGLDQWVPDPKALMHKVMGELAFDATRSTLYFIGTGFNTLHLDRLHYADKNNRSPWMHGELRPGEKYGEPVVFELFVEWKGDHYVLLGEVQHELVVPPTWYTTTTGPRVSALSVMNEKGLLKPALRTRLAVQVRQVNGLELMYRLLKDE